MPAVATNENVFWFQVAMDEAEGVDEREGHHALPGNLLQSRHREVAATSQLQTFRLYFICYWMNKHKLKAHNGEETPSSPPLTALPRFLCCTWRIHTNFL